MKRLYCLLGTCILLLGSVPVLAQNVTVTGTIRNASTNEMVNAVSVSVKATTYGTFTDNNGSFSISLPSDIPFPITLIISSIGYETREVIVNAPNDKIDVNLNVAPSLGQEVVISATRTPSRIMESPVTIERVSNTMIRNAPATNYYDIVGSLKGVDMVAASLTFKTPTTRGFGSSGNTRFTQIVEGMDNQAPGLNFSVGSIVGLMELDVDNMELLSGASSALYGPGGMNGTLLISGKNPFKYQGFSFQFKQGIMHLGQDAQRDPSPFFDVGARYAQKIGDKFAFKITAELIQAKDWLASDYRDYKREGSNGQVIPGTRETDPNYDGINVYGDETTTNIKSILNIIGQQAPFLNDYIQTLPANIPVSRTGYTEKEITDPNTVNFKVTGSLHYKISNTVEASLSAFWGTGNTVYTGSNRYSLKDFKMGQYKLELNGRHWNARAYTTQENAGLAHNLGVTTQLFNEAWKPSTTWYPIYSQTFLGAKLNGLPDYQAHALARATADQGRPIAGTDQFNRIFDSIRGIPVPNGGKLLDRSDLYMVEGQYDFSDAIKFIEVLAGASWKQYVLNSQGTLFADKPGDPITIQEYGAYVQLSKSLFNEVLRLTASGRYDKNENFEGRFTPRLTALIKPAKNHNIRLSYQTAYRFPSTQQQWIDLDVGTGRLLGGVKDLWDKYNMINNPVYDPASVAAGNPQIVPYVQFKPESVVSYEAGYKSLIAKKLLIDAYIYISDYTDFLSRRDVIQKKDPDGPITDLADATKRNGYSIVVNAPGKVKARGWGIGFEYLFPANFTMAANVSSDELTDVPDGFRSFFNTPKYRTNLSVGNTGFGPDKRIGFNVAWRWQDGFYFDGDFAAGDIPAFHNVDAQISYKFPDIRSVVKLGATNLLNQYYATAIGNPFIGGLYYMSFGFNVY